MNASAFSDLLGQIPGDMLVSAFQNAMPDSHAADDSPAHALPQQRAKAPADSISVPRWFTAAALAACMLFAVGVGAFLLRGHPDDMTTQSSQDDSAAVTAVYTETAEHLTQTAASASAAKPPETVTAAVSGTAEPAETAPQETESAETEPQDTEPDERADTAEPQPAFSTESTEIRTETTAVTTAEPVTLSGKAAKEVAAAVDAGETEIPVHLYFEQVNVEAQAQKMTKEYQATLDPAQYTTKEINELIGSYYIQAADTLWHQALKERAAAILTELGVNPDSAICYADSPEISCTLTPQQIMLADRNTLITNITKGYTWTYSGTE